MTILFILVIANLVLLNHNINERKVYSSFMNCLFLLVSFNFALLTVMK